MAIEVSGQVGPFLLADGVSSRLRLGRSGELVTQALHGQHYEQNLRGVVFSGGMALTSISNVTFTVGTLGATCTPIVGVWNPFSSLVNLVLIRATLGVTITALQAQGGGPYVWATSTANIAISTGNLPFNRKTMLQSGSFAKDMSGVALTGLTTNLVVRGASALSGGSAYNANLLATAVGMHPSQAAAEEVFDGQFIVPPGGVVALLATTTPIAHSATSALIWEEIPLQVP